nr:hypothetical protein [Bacteroidota bacterium]
MKAKTIELNVDYIGDQTSCLTKDEINAISEYIRSKKTKKIAKSSKKKIVA